MCGIAGYSLTEKSELDRTLAAQALLAGIAERGADAVGYAYRNGGHICVHKQRSGASALLDRIEANNHPIRHGSVVGIHNGIIFNDEDIFSEHGFARAVPGMTVDSEAIFALAEAADSDARALKELRGSMATAWMDERRPGTVFLARGAGRPLWVGAGRAEAFFASTKHALEIVERYLGLKLRKRELSEGTLVVLAEGGELAEESFEPDRNFEERPLPPVRAPKEGVSCLQRLAALATLG